MEHADAARVGAVHVQVWREAYVGLMPDDYLAGLEASSFGSTWEERLAGPTPHGVLHRAGVAPDGAIVGIGTAGPGREHETATLRELWAINVLASAHGSGLADLMMAALLGDEPAYLWVLEGNERAISFYRRHGFEPDGVTKPFAPSGAVELRMVR